MANREINILTRASLGKTLFFIPSCFILLLPANYIWSQEHSKIVDAGQREVHIPEQIRTVVGLGPGTLRTLVYLGVAEKVIGVEWMEKRSQSARPYWLACPQLGSLPVVGPGGPAGINKDPDLEVMLRLKPDVIFVSYMEIENADKLQARLNIPVVLLSGGGTLGDFLTSLGSALFVAGKVLRTEKRAKEIMDFIEMTKTDIIQRSSRVNGYPKPSTYVGCIGFKGLHGIESSEANYPPFVWTHARTYTHQPNEIGHLTVDKELILKWDPDIIFIDASGLRVLRDDYAKKTDYYKGLRAFQNSDVYVLFPLNTFAVNAGNALVNAYAVGKILYPLSFNDIDLPAKADEIYKFLVGKPVYKEMERCWGTLGRCLHLEE